MYKVLLYGIDCMKIFYVWKLTELWYNVMTYNSYKWTDDVLNATSTICRTKQLIKICIFIVSPQAITHLRVASSILIIGTKFYCYVLYSFISSISLDDFIPLLSNRHIHLCTCGHQMMTIDTSKMTHSWACFSYTIVWK